jgi:hypothetical protein
MSRIDSGSLFTNFQNFFGEPVQDYGQPQPRRSHNGRDRYRSEGSERSSRSQDGRARGVMSMLGGYRQPHAHKQPARAHHKQVAPRAPRGRGQHPLPSGHNGSNQAVLGGGSGADAVRLGQQFMHQSSRSLRGRLPNFQAAGGVTNNCADFVSALLQNTGRLKGHYNKVSDLQTALGHQGYRRVSKSQAQPGDVWIRSDAGHTELVETPGATKLLGSNGSAFQTIRESGAGSGYYYHLAR